MVIIVGIVSDLINNLRFKDTVMYKNSSELQDKYNTLIKLQKEYPNNKEINSELFVVKRGLVGENEIAYQLSKSNIGMYILRDIKLKYEDLTAQIDYIVITMDFIYYIECKNLYGNITVNEKGDFIREFSSKGQKVKKGMYSPLRQVEAQREVVRKIWQANSSKLKLLLASHNFDYYRRVLVVAANPETVLNTYRAPKDIKNKVIRADALVRKIQSDLDNREPDDSLYSKDQMEKIAASYVEMSVNESIDYYDYYKNKFNLLDLKDELIAFRKRRSLEKKIPAYYVFSNDELERILKFKPQNIRELNGLISEIKIRPHGKEIIKIINKNN